MCQTSRKHSAQTSCHFGHWPNLERYGFTLDLTPQTALYSIFSTRFLHRNSLKQFYAYLGPEKVNKFLLDFIRLESNAINRNITAIVHSPSAEKSCATVPKPEMSWKRNKLSAHIFRIRSLGLENKWGMMRVQLKLYSKDFVWVAMFCMERMTDARMDACRDTNMNPRTEVHKDVRMHASSDGCTPARTTARTHIQTKTGPRTDRRGDRRAHGETHDRKHTRVNVRTDGSMDGWMSRLIAIPTLMLFFCSWLCAPQLAVTSSLNETSESKSSNPSSSSNETTLVLWLKKPLSVTSSRLEFPDVDCPH